MNDWLKLKKVVRYLLKFPYMKRVYYKQTLENAGVTAYSDSDWAGDLKTRRSTSGSVIKWGSHTLLVKGSSQKVVALSSSESEYYAMARTATLSEFIRGIFEFWGWKARVTKLKVDSSSAKALSERRGVGQSRHIQAKFLWVQDRVAEKLLEIEKVKGPENDADLVTKVSGVHVLLGCLEHHRKEALASLSSAGLSTHLELLQNMEELGKSKETPGPALCRKVLRR
eukprot:s53_g35.t1